MYTFQPNRPSKGIYNRPTPELERWLKDSASATLFAGIFAKSPYPEAHQANTSYSCKPPDTSANTIPPGFERKVAAEGWPKAGESIFNKPKPGLSETELRDLVKVLHARGDELLESVKHCMLAENQSTPSPAKVPSDRTDPPSPTEWTECRGRGKPTSFALDDPSFDEVRRLHEMTSDLDSRVRSLLLESPAQPPQPDPVEPNLHASHPQHGHQLLSIQHGATGHQQEHRGTLNTGKNTQTSSLPDSNLETSTGKPQRRSQNQAQRRQVVASPEIPFGPSSSTSRSNNYQYQHRGSQFTFPPTGPQRYGVQYSTMHNGLTERGFHRYEAPQGQPSQGYHGRGPLPIQHANGFQPRPPPKTQRLYEPGLTTTNSYLQRQQQNQVFSPPVWASINAQIEWLNRVAQGEIGKAQISTTELVEKENLRLVLEVVCREVISELERSKDGSFDPSSVALRNFGSLRSGFATHSADMDLVLLSPHSRPDLASADSEIPRMLEKRLLELGHGAQLLTRTRVPIIKFCEKPTPELLEVLRVERTKWEAYRLRQAHKEQTLQSNDPQPNNYLSSPPASVEQSSSQKDNAGPGSSPAKSEDHAEENQEYSLEALVEMYEMAIRDGWYNDLERGVIRQFVELVKQHRADPDNPELIKARLALDSLPDNLRRYRRKRGFCSARLEFPKTGVGIHCDINFSNHLALHNTQLLRCYCLCDSRVRDMVIFVKAWAKRRKINSAYHGTLSSYGYVLMVLHYLVNVATPPVLPNLQLAWKPPTSGSYGALLEETTADGYDVRFWRSESEITKRAASGRLTDNQESVGSLLRGFFGYFAHQGTHIIWGGFSWGYDVLSLRTRGGIVSKQSKGWVAAKTETVEPAAPGQEAKEVRQRYLFAIEDPFEHEHNIARTVVHHGIVAIRDEFRRAYSIIQRAGQGGVVDDLFVEAPDRRDLPRKRDTPKQAGADGKPQQSVQKAAIANKTVAQLERP